MATFVNDLRLTELATGEGSGTWGTTTNTNLELVAEAFSFGTEAITTNADTHTTTIADGATDPGRSIFLKYTGTLDSACTITIGPNTVSKLWFIENATSGSQSIIVSQGSGANITIPNGQTKAIYSDGAGSGAAMVDAFQDLSVPDLFVDDDLTIGDDLVFSSDSAVITFGADGDTTLTHTDGSGLTLNSTNKLMFNDASQFIQGSSATVLSLGATDEIDLTATAIDVNGTIDVSGNATLGGTLGVTGAVTANAGISIDNITIDGTEIDLSSGDLTIDVAGDIILDADGGDFNFKDGGTTLLSLSNAGSNNVQLSTSISDGDLLIKGNDGGSIITALTLDMSNAGAALFNGAVTTGDTITVNSGSLNLASDGGTLFIGADIDMRLTHDGSNGTFRCDTGSMNFDVAGGITLDSDSGQVDFKDGGTLKALIDFTSDNVEIQARATDGDLLFRGQDGSSFITALTLDMSAAGFATFNDGATFSPNSGTLDIKVGTHDATNNVRLNAGGTTSTYLEYRGYLGHIFDVNTTRMMTLTSTGLGINIDDPTAKLHIVEATSTPAVKIKSGTSTNQNTHITMFNNNDGGTLAIGVFGSGASTFGTITAADAFITANQELCLNSQNSSGAIKFGVGSTPSERWRIDSNGVLVSGGNTPVGIAGDPADANFVEIGPGYMNLARDDTAAAAQILFAKNGTSVSSIQTSGNGLILQVTDGQGSVVVNDAGNANTDFRVESNANANGLLYDAGTQKLSINGTYLGSDVGFCINGISTDSIACLELNGDRSTNSTVNAIRMYCAGTEVGTIDTLRDGADNTAAMRFFTSSSGTLTEGFKLTSSGQPIFAVARNDTTSDAANMNIRSSDGLVRRSTSSRRYKNTITDATHGLTELLTLRPVTYKGNNDGDRLFGGLIAEEVHEAGLTEFVQYNGDDEPDALAYGHMVSLCIKAIQEQQALIEALQAEVAALKGE